MEITLSENKKGISKEKGRYNETSNYGITEISSESDSICRWDLKMINCAGTTFVGVTHKYDTTKNITWPERLEDLSIHRPD